ncbi:hypothetical protein JCM14076_15720 [Methylosoma difficile]
MQRHEIFELVLIVLSVLCVYPFGDVLPMQLELGRLLLYLSAILLLQGLLRDCYLLTIRRKQSAGNIRQAMRCLCAESTLGWIGIIIGAALMGFDLAMLLVLSVHWWAVMVFTVLAIGFAGKNFVFAWRPLRIIYDPDHINIVVKWR